MGCVAKTVPPVGPIVPCGLLTLFNLAATEVRYSEDKLDGIQRYWVFDSARVRCVDVVPGPLRECCLRHRVQIRAALQVGAALSGNG
jgi:hypothetical protein